MLGALVHFCPGIAEKRVSRNPLFDHADETFFFHIRNRCSLWQAGQALNHDELVVYKEEAALPTHLIVYSVP